MLVELRRLALRAAHGVAVQVDLEGVLGNRVLAVWGGGMQPGQHADLALLELLADLDVAVGGIADHPPRAPRLGLLVDQPGGVVAVVLVAGRDGDRGQHRRVLSDEVCVVVVTRPRCRAAVPA